MHKYRSKILNSAGAKKIYDEVHGYIDLTEVELKIVDTPYFQRLRYVKQLAVAWYVYPGATHTRFSHSIGATHLMGLVAEKLAELGYIHSFDDVQMLRLSALLHDIGHTPFSHAIEPFYKDLLGLGHEEITRMIILESEIRDILDYFGYDPKTITAVIEGRYREPIYNQLLSSDIDVDRMDYLIRDAIHTGVTYGIIDLQRIISTLVVDGDGNIAILDKGIDALENFYLARMHMYKTVYYHKTVVGYETLLRRIYEIIYNNYSDTLLPKNANDLKRLIENNDIALWHDDWLMGVLIKLYKDSLVPREIRDLIGAFLFRRGYKIVLEKSKFSNDVLDLENDEDVKELKSIINELGKYVKPYEIAMFIDDIRIVEEDPHVAPRIIQGNKQSVAISYIENSIIPKLPKKYHVKRLYALSSSWDIVAKIMRDKII